LLQKGEFDVRKVFLLLGLTFLTLFTASGGALGSCQVTLDCKDGNVLQCSGTSCQSDAYVGYVQCNGVRQDCPNRCQVFLYGCCPDSDCWSTCISTSGDCAEGPGYIRCDDKTITCSICRRSC
jgi:hypothetical protein